MAYFKQIIKKKLTKKAYWFYSWKALSYFFLIKHKINIKILNLLHKINLAALCVGFSVKNLYNYKIHIKIFTFFLLKII